MSRTISNADDVIDSRDIIARLDELDSERQTLAAVLDEATDDDAKSAATMDLVAFDEDDDRGGELARLRALVLVDEGENVIADWKHGETLIRDSYFEDYARELAEDIGAIGKDLPWPACHIDWEAAADALKMDYSSVEYGDVTYWVR